MPWLDNFLFNVDEGGAQPELNEEDFLSMLLADFQATHPPASIRRPNRKKGDVNAIQELAQENFGRAMSENRWGENARQMDISNIPGVEQTRPRPPMPPAGPQVPFDDRIPPDADFNRMMTGAGTTHPMAEDPEWQDPNDPNSPMNAGPLEGRDSLLPDWLTMATSPGRAAPDGPPLRSPLPPTEAPAPDTSGVDYSNTMYAGMTPEQRELMQLQPDENQNTLRRVSDSLGVPVEFQHGLGGRETAMPVFDPQSMDQLSQADPQQQAALARGIFSDEIVDGTPTFTNDSIRRREQLDWIPDAEAEKARIERDAQEAFERTPQVRAAREEARINEEAAESDHRRDMRMRMMELGMQGITGNLSRAQQRMQENAWAPVTDQNGVVHLSALVNNPDLANAMAEPLSEQISHRLRQAGAIGERRGQVNEDDVKGAIADLLQSSQFEQIFDNLPTGHGFTSDNMNDLMVAAFALPQHTSGFRLASSPSGFFTSPFNQNKPGEWLATSMGHTVNTLADLMAAEASGTTIRSGGQRFRLDDMPPALRETYNRLQPNIERVILHNDDARRDRYVAGKKKELERDIRRLERQSERRQQIATNARGPARSEMEPRDPTQHRERQEAILQNRLHLLRLDGAPEEVVSGPLAPFTIQVLQIPEDAGDEARSRAIVAAEREMAQRGVPDEHIKRWKRAMTQSG